MKQLRALCLIVFLSCLGATARAEEPVGWEIKSDNDQGFFEFDLAEGIYSFTNRVAISYSNAVLKADSAVANANTGEVEAQGNVVVTAKGIIWTGERVSYNFKTQQMGSDKFKTGQAPFVISGRG